MTAHVENTDEFFLQTQDGVSLFVRDWPANNHSVKHGIIILHGLGEHCGRYIHIARFFQTLGFTVRCFDQRGHGQSEGRRGDVPNSSSSLDDLCLVLDEFSQHLDAPPLLFAHSMGGLFACHFALASRSKLSGLILASPALKVNVSLFQRCLFAVASRVIPHLGVTHGTNGRYLSHDNEVVYAYQNDPLVHSRISASLFQSMLHSMEYVKAHASQMKIPLLLLIAGADQVVDPEGSQLFSQQLDHRLTASSVTTIVYPDFYHEIFNELDSIKAFDDVRIWLDEKNLMPLNL
jgi:alpha-beta hydrolase superfamily lysophospholipase